MKDYDNYLIGNMYSKIAIAPHFCPFKIATFMKIKHRDFKNTFQILGFTGTFLLPIIVAFGNHLHIRTNQISQIKNY